jgi:hypothetical protein
MVSFSLSFEVFPFSPPLQADIGSPRLPQAPPGCSRQPRRSLEATQSVRIGCRTSKAFWQVYIARQSFPSVEGVKQFRDHFNNTCTSQMPCGGKVSVPRSASASHLQLKLLHFSQRPIKNLNHKGARGFLIRFRAVQLSYILLLES